MYPQLDRAIGGIRDLDAIEEILETRVAGDAASPSRDVVVAGIDDHDADPMAGLVEASRQIELAEIPREEVREVDRRRDDVHALRDRGVRTDAQWRDLLGDQVDARRDARDRPATGQLSADDALVEQSAAMTAIVGIEGARSEGAAKAMPLGPERRAPLAPRRTGLADQGERRAFQAGDALEDGALRGTSS